MSTPLTDSIENLTNYINEVTGGSDDNLSDAIATLADGYTANTMRLLRSIPVDNVASIDFTITDELFGGYKALVVIPNVILTKDDWLYLEIESSNVYSGKAAKQTYPRFFINKQDVCYEYFIRTGITQPKNVRINETASGVLCNYHVYTNGVFANGSIDIYGSNLDLYKE